MSNENINISRRNFLTAATCVVGCFGAGLGVVPFVNSWLPSAQAMAMGGPVDVDTKTIEPGKKITVSWRGKPVFIINREQSSIDKLNSINSRLRDPESNISEQPVYTKNIERSINKYLVVVGICTHLGCVPIFHPKVGELEPSWVGGFYCPCHGSKFDMAGRVYKGVPAPVNLTIPPYRFIDANTLRIGEDHRL